MPAGPRFKDALACFARHRAVGGVSGVLQGAPISTLDLDLVHARAPDNVERVVSALTELDARYRDLTGRVLRPQAAALSGPGHHLLLTNAGPIDMLGQIDDNATFEDLLPESDELVLDDLTISARQRARYGVSMPRC